MVDLLQGMGVHSRPSLILTVPGACSLSSLGDEVHTLPSCCVYSLVGACGLNSLLDEVRTLPTWCTHLLVVHTVPSQCAHSPVGAYGVRPPQVCTSATPCALDLVSIPPHLRGNADGWVVGGRGDWSCCCWKITQSAPEGLFLFGKILLLNPAAPSIQGRACPLAQPTSPARPGLSGSGPHTVQVSTLPSWCPWSP